MNLAISFIKKLQASTHDDGKKFTYALLVKGLAKSLLKIDEKEDSG
jgi:hypothetical protein